MKHQHADARNEQCDAADCVIAGCPARDGIYGEAFFAHMAGCREPYRRLGEAIADALGGVRNVHVLDIGCGLGFVIERLAESGAVVAGADGFASTSSHRAQVPIMACDLESDVFRGPDYDVIICTETAEHLSRFAGADLVGAIAKHARKAIVWSAAPPGQNEDDPGHINLRQAAYWLALFELGGWLVDEEKTARLRALMLETHAQHEYCAGNFHILKRGKRST